ncbi:MAG TPA: iron ABC transporter permease [Terriglobales bacterium]|nr:iron ABC transporter permease [Terriglobales bacterium]
MKAATELQGIQYKTHIFGGLGQRLNVRIVFFCAVIAVLAYLTLGPLIFLLWDSFYPGWEIGDSVSFTLASYYKVFGDPRFFEMLTNTAVFGLGATALAVGLGSIFAWLVERTNMPFRNVTYALLFAPVAIPGLVFAISYILLLSPDIGVLNKALMDLFGLEQAPFNIYTMPGLIFVEGIRLTPGSFLMMSAVLKSMDPSLEEAAYTTGAGILRTSGLITAPLMLPGILAAFIYYFITVIESFEIPAIIALPIGMQLLTTKIFFATHTTTEMPQYSVAAAVSIIFILLSIALVYLFTKATKHSERFTTITGKAYRPRIIDLGNWRYAALGITILFFAFSVIFPLLVLIWGSLLPYLQPPSITALSHATLDSYRNLGQIPKFGLALTNTVIVTFAVATATMLLSALAAWFVVRGKIRGGRSMDLLTFLPHAIPSIVVAVGLIILYLRINWMIPVYGTIWIIIIGMITKRISYGSRIMIGAMFQLHKELEEASEVCGVGWLKTFCLITLRLLVPAFVNGWLYSAMLSIALFTIPVMLYTPRSVVFSVLIWNLWEAAKVQDACVVGVVMVTATFTLVFLGQYFASRARVQQTLS